MWNGLRGRRGEVVWYRGLINQDNKIVQEGQIVLLVEARPPVKGNNERRLTAPDAALISPNGTME